ncbi:MAG: hypothetical protein C5B50_26815 [Verrucomicrobia bacterium]|nr:MAG: hypothetical protein C5B50_26815 [Verrucomicrobiota bacterium]
MVRDGYPATALMKLSVRSILQKVLLNQNLPPTPEAALLKFEIWSFFEVWSLNFEVSPSDVRA